MGARSVFRDTLKGGRDVEKHNAGHYFCGLVVGLF